jgi:hypothetical protein
MPLPRSKWDRVVLFLGGLAALAAAGLLIAGETRYWRRGVTTTGKVTAIEQKPAGFDQSSSQGTTPRYVYRVQYQYTDAAGATYFGELTTSWDKYQEGQEVSVQYLEAAPERSRVAADPDMWWVWPAAALLLLFGLCLVAVAGIDLVRKAAPEGGHTGKA